MGDTDPLPRSGGPPVVASFSVPPVLGSYRLLREIGRGGMGIVFEAQDETLARRVAVKVLGPWLTGQAEAQARFEAEARALAQLRHPNIVQIHGAGREGDLFYFVMELLDGLPLSQSRWEGGRLSAERTMEIGLDVANALGEAHKFGIVHRDLKPHNIVADHQGRLKVTDFGLARVGGGQLTAAGQVLGTPTYWAPELVQGAEASPASDVYALGVVLYEVLTGEPPFAGDSPFQVAFRHVSETPADVRGRNPQVPADLGDLVMRCLVKDPTGRPSSRSVGSELHRQLERHRSFQKLLLPLRVRVAAAGSGSGSRAEELEGFQSAWGVVVFADLVGFTSLSAAAAPATVGRILSEFFTAIAREVGARRGHVVNYIGDCCLAVFLGGEPRETLAACLDACQAMVPAVAAVGERLAFGLRLRIGLNAGDLLVGPIHDGSSFHLSLLGETVNVASRVETLGKVGAICASESVLPWLPEGWRASRYGEWAGRGGSGAIYELER